MVLSGGSVAYTFDTTVDGDVDSWVPKVTEALKAEGFGVLTEIDVKATFKKKLDRDFRPYRILGACNPNFAFMALSTEPNIGAMLPCNVVLQESAPGKVQVSAVDPVASMSGVPNPDLAIIAGEVRAKLQKVIASLA
jgi:uncharacterized protein (DUF302 family)